MTNSKELVAQLSTNVNVGMDEVVSVFVSKYENTLFEKKSELSKAIKAIKGTLKDLTKSLVLKVDRSQYETTVPILNLVSKVEDVTVDWDGNTRRKIKPSIHVSVSIKDKDSTGSYRDEITKDISIPISTTTLKRHTELDTELTGLNDSLLEVMGLIKSVSRKERQVRGRISELKLQEAGFEELLESEEMLKLIQLD